MSEIAATPTGSGSMTVAQAADMFEDALDPQTEDTQEVADETGEEPEADTEQDVDAEGEPEDAEESDDSKKPELHTVKVDGEEIQVPIDELVKGYQRTADYTRKTQALAEQRKAAESEFEAVRGERAHYSQMLGQLQKQIQQSEPQIDWASLERENPAEWTRQKLLVMERQQSQAYIAAEQARIAEAQQAEYDQATHSKITEEAQKLLKAIPEWKDEAVSKAQKAKLVAFAQERGYTADEVSQVIDSRAILLLMDAMKYRDAAAKRASLKATPEAATPKPAVPGRASNGQSKASVTQQATQRLARSGKVADAAALFERFL